MTETRRTAKFVIVGGGAWGTTLALLAHRARNQVTLVVHREEDATYMTDHRNHPYSLSGVLLPADISFTSDISALAGADVIVLAVPVQRLRDAATTISSQLGISTVLSAAKGLELGTQMRPSEILTDVLGPSIHRRLAVLSGPNLATEIANGHPAASVVASSELQTARLVQDHLMSSRFRIYTSVDVIGVELGGALKNVIAIGAGIADGLDVGDNAKSSFVTRGIAEIVRLGVACGADPMTFGGLSGIGDLIATCSSRLSRNYRVGYGVAQGRSLSDILAEMGETAEGIATTSSALALARELQVEMPISEQISRVLFDGVDARTALDALMMRVAAPEIA